MRKKVITPITTIAAIMITNRVANAIYAFVIERVARSDHRTWQSRKIDLPLRMATMIAKAMTNTLATPTLLESQRAWKDFFSLYAVPFKIF